MTADDSASPRARLAVVDLARGGAIVAMVVYHLTWDLGPDFIGFISLNAAEDPFLRLFARAIAGSFLFLVGVSLVLAHHRGLRARPYLKRLAVIVGAALLVTIVTRVAIPELYVRFGILHAIAAASVVGLVFLRAPTWLVLLVAVGAFGAPSFLAAEFFNHPAWIWLGLNTIVPPMNDYVPVLPWVGPTLLGIIATRLALDYGLDRRWGGWRPASAAGRGLIFAGRWSLIIYLVHQPILLGLSYGVALAIGHPTPALF